MSIRLFIGLRSARACTSSCQRRPRKGCAQSEWQQRAREERRGGDKGTGKGVWDHRGSTGVGRGNSDGNAGPGKNDPGRALKRYLRCSCFWSRIHASRSVPLFTTRGTVRDMAGAECSFQPTRPPNANPEPTRNRPDPASTPLRIYGPFTNSGVMSPSSRGPVYDASTTVRRAPQDVAKHVRTRARMGTTQTIQGGQRTDGLVVDRVGDGAPRGVVVRGNRLGKLFALDNLVHLFVLGTRILVRRHALHDLQDESGRG